MTRLAIGIVIGLGIGIVAAAAIGIHAEQFPTEETIAAAAEAGVDALDLQGAVNTTGLEPREYLIAVGDLAPSASPQTGIVSNTGWPFVGAIAQRIYCVEGIESSHGRALYNPTPWHGEHAQGWLGWLPSTARAWGAVIGNRASEWAAAARMFATLTPQALGRQFYGVGAGIC